MLALEIKNLSKSFDGKIVWRNVHLAVTSGQVCHIAGPSGIGKTTLLRCIAGLTLFEKGQIYLKGCLIQSDRVYIHPSKRNINMVFQQLNLWPHMTAGKNVEFAARSYLDEKSKRAEWVDELLSRFQIADKRHDFPERLSGGEQQRIAIARAIASSPRLLLMDEPFNQLDAPLRESLAEEIKRITHEKGITLVIASHHQISAADFYDRQFTFDSKSLIEITDN